MIAGDDRSEPRRGRLACHAFWTLVGHVAGKGAGFAFVIIVARGLGAREYGQFNFALSFVSLFLLAGSYAIEPAVIRELARSRERLSEVFASGLLLRMALALAALALAVGLSPLFVAGGRDRAVVVLLGLALCLDELTTYVGSVYKAFERVALHGLAVVANRVLSAMLALATLAAGGDIIPVCLAYLTGSLGAAVFAWIGLRRYFPPIELRAVRRPVVRELLVDGVPMAMAGVFNAALFRIDMVLVVAIAGPVAGGFYGLAYRFFETFLFLAWSLADITLPRIARAGRGADSGRTFQLGVAAMLAFFLPVTVIAPFAAEWGVTSLFSEAFRPAAAAVPWLAAAGVFYGIAYTARVALVGLGSSRRIVVGTAALVLTANVVANLAVIPRHGFLGAAVITLLSEVLEAVLLLGAFVRANGGLYLRRWLLAPVAAAAAALVVILATDARDGTAVVFGLLAYVGALPAAAWLLARNEVGGLVGRPLRLRTPVVPAVEG